MKKSILAFLLIIMSGCSREAVREDSFAGARELLRLGISARDDYSSYVEIVSGTNPDHWGQLKFKDSYTAFSIQALGLSRRDTNLLVHLKHYPPSYLHKFAGDIVQAEFYIWYDKKYGIDESNLGKLDKLYFIDLINYIS